MSMLKRVLLGCCLLFSSMGSFAETWSTWMPWEADSVMAAWAVSRYQNRNSEFYGVPKGTEVDPLLSFDNPHSEIRRDGKETTFQKMIKRLAVTDGCVERLSHVSYVVEMIPWQKSLYPDVVELELKLRPHIPYKPGKVDLDKAFNLLDQYCNADD